MKITCPACSKSYNVKASALGDAGRNVKCKNCGERWFASPDAVADAGHPGDGPGADRQRPSTDDIIASARQTGQDLPARLSSMDAHAADIRKAAADAAASAGDDGDIIAVPAKTGAGAPGTGLIEGSVAEAARSMMGAPLKAKIKLKSAAGSVKRELPLQSVAAVLALLAVMMAGFVMRDTVVKAAPDLAGIYRLAGVEINVRGLAFRDVETIRARDSGQDVLIVKGIVENISKSVRPVPAIQFRIEGREGEEINVWSIRPNTNALQSGERVDFRTTMIAPPSSAANIEVRFVDRSNRSARLF